MQYYRKLINRVEFSSKTQPDSSSLQQNCDTHRPKKDVIIPLWVELGAEKLYLFERGVLPCHC